MSSLTSEEILDSIQQRGLAPDDIIGKLRARVRQRPEETGPTALTSWLVKNNLLTQFQADELLNGGETVKRGLPPENAPLAEIIDESASPLFGDLGYGSAGYGASGLGGLGLGTAARAGTRPKADTAATPTWDSKLMLLGGGALLILMLAAGMLYWLIGRGSGDDAFRLAEEDYNAGNYTQAIEKYNHFLKDYESHSQAGMARVHRGLARMRQLTTRPADWTQALADVEAILQEVRREREFPEARVELASILPRLAEGLVQQAQAQQDAEVLAQADQAFNLIQNNNYVPQNLRNEEGLRRLEALRAEVQRELDRGRELNTALDEIAAAAARGETATAYAIRRDLVKTYPDLDNNPRLYDALLEVTAAERLGVQYVDEPAQPVTEEPESAVTAVTSLASTSGTAVPGVQGRQVFALASGAAYGLDAATGQLLWRRFVGFDSTFLPQAIGADGSDVILIDAVRSELVRVEAASGKLRWRLPLEGGLPLPPAIAGNTAWIATREGRLYQVDLDTGQSPGYFAFPQPLSTPPVVAASGNVIYQFGQQGSLYILETGQQAGCRNVVYLGHAPDGISAAPLLIEGVYLLAAVNTGARYSQLITFRLEDDGKQAVPVKGDALDGQVHSPPQREGNAVVVATDSGALYMFAVGDVDAEQPLVLIARQAGSARVPQVPQVRLTAEHLWIADRMLQCYAFQEAAGSFAPVWQRYRGGVSVQPLQRAGQALIYARREPGKPGVAIAALGAISGEPYWETVLAAPSATGPLVDPQSQTVSAVTTGGALFELPLSQVEQGHSAISKPAQQVPVDWPLSTTFPVSRFSDGQWVVAIAADGRQLLVATPDGRGRRLDWKPLPDAATFPPVKQYNRLLVPGALGQVFSLLPSTWQADAEPFQPPIENGRRYRWQATLQAATASMSDAVDPEGAPDDIAPSFSPLDDTPKATVPQESGNLARANGSGALASAQGETVVNESPFLLAEAGGKLYLLALSYEPIPHLAQLAEAQLERPLATPLAAIDGTALAVDEAHRLLAIAYDDLRPRVVAQLDGPPTWGPEPVGKAVLLATEDHRLCCYNSDGSERWQLRLHDGPLAGDPAAVNGDLIVATVGGTLRRLNAATGEEMARADVGEPLARGAVAAGDRLLLTSPDGSLLSARLP